MVSVTFCSVRVVILPLMLMDLASGSMTCHAANGRASWFSTMLILGTYPTPMVESTALPPKVGASLTEVMNTLVCALALLMPSLP